MISYVVYLLSKNLVFTQGIIVGQLPFMTGLNLFIEEVKVMIPVYTQRQNKISNKLNHNSSQEWNIIILLRKSGFGFSESKLRFMRSREIPKMCKEKMAPNAANPKNIC